MLPAWPPPAALLVGAHLAVTLLHLRDLVLLLVGRLLLLLGGSLLGGFCAGGARRRRPGAIGGRTVRGLRLGAVDRGRVVHLRGGRVGSRGRRARAGEAQGERAEMDDGRLI